MTRLRRIALAGLFASSFVGPALADRIIVRNGSSIRGKAIVDEAHPDQYLVFGEKGKTPLILKRDRVARIDPEPSVLDDYVVRRRAITKASSPQDEFDLGLWCEEHRLLDLASVHYEGSIRRDPSFGPGHRKLGHAEYGGRWLTPAEMKAAQGFVLYKGKWITPEEKAEHDAEASASAEQQSWMRRLAILRQGLLSGIESRTRDAEAQLMAIREPAAVNPVVRTFGGDSDPAFRKLAARVLVGIPGPEASSALVNRLLAEGDDDVRAATMAELARSKELNVVPKLMQGLQSKSLAVVNRAAWALGNVKAVRAVPRLVPLLVSSEVQMVWVPSQPPQGSGFAGGAPATGFNISGGRSIPILTGPAVGPGVVAYGATSVPASSFGGGFNVSMGGGGNQGPTPQFVEIKHRNVEVLTALMKLTGQDFGYDVAAWQRWVSTSYRPEASPAKSVPQP